MTSHLTDAEKGNQISKNKDYVYGIWEYKLLVITNKLFAR